MFHLALGYPSAEEEYRIVRRTVAADFAPIAPVLSRARILRAIQLARKVHMPPEILEYAVKLCRMSRPRSPETPDSVQSYVSWGAGPRASQSLILGAKARALLQGRTEAGAADVRAVFLPAMRHRISLNYHAEADGLAPDKVLERALLTTRAPDGFRPDERSRRASRLRASERT
jgi:MoxR-like ATPase